MGSAINGFGKVVGALVLVICATFAILAFLAGVLYSFRFHTELAIAIGAPVVACLYALAFCNFLQEAANTRVLEIEDPDRINALWAAEMGPDTGTILLWLMLVLVYLAPSFVAYAALGYKGGDMEGLIMVGLSVTLAAGTALLLVRGLIRMKRPNAKFTRWYRTKLVAV